MYICIKYSKLFINFFVLTFDVMVDDIYKIDKEMIMPLMIGHLVNILLPENDWLLSCQKEGTYGMNNMWDLSYALKTREFNFDNTKSQNIGKLYVGDSVLVRRYSDSVFAQAHISGIVHKGNVSTVKLEDLTSLPIDIPQWDFFAKSQNKNWRSRIISLR